MSNQIHQITGKDKLNNSIIIKWETTTITSPTFAIAMGVFVLTLLTLLGLLYLLAMWVRRRRQEEQSLDHVLLQVAVPRDNEVKIDAELKGLKKAFPNESFDITTRLKHTILAINGDSSAEKIRYFVDNMMLQDSRALRKYINEITPDLDMTFSYEDSKGDIVEGVSIPMNLNFLWPDVQL